MKITVTAAEPKDNKLEATLTVAAADVDAAIKKAYKDIANKYRFQGFRKGKAPRPPSSTAWLVRTTSWPRPPRTC